MARIAIVSDSHLSPRNPEADENWASVVAHIERRRPDLVVHLGDLTLDGPARPDELRSGRRQLDRLAVPWRAVPGNHDIGDNPWDGQPDDERITADRLGAWRTAIGPDRWSMAIEGWLVVAVDAQLFGSGLDAEDEQWSWLEQLLGDGTDARVALLTHKPIAASEAELAEAPGYRFSPAPARRRLGQLLDLRSTPLVVSGHCHQYRQLDFADRLHVWAPTTWAVFPESIQPCYGQKRCGLLELELHGDGRADLALVEPRGIRQLTLAEDVGDPYGE